MKNKPDLINVWPNNCDYPIWRQMILDNRDKFNLVITVFMNPNTGYNFSSYVRDVMKGGYTLFLDSPPIISGEDWRDVATNYAIMHTGNAEWLLFMEQDFFPLEGFWEEVEKQQDSGAEVIGVKDGSRLHPCFLMIKRKLIDLTSRDFSADKNAKWDHFGKIQMDIEMLGFDVRIIDQSLYNHMNGLSHNFRLMSEGQTPNYKEDEYYSYIVKTLQSNIPLDNKYAELAKNYINRRNGK